MGSKINPYKYMKECNIYSQPSRHERYCITLTEAKSFNKVIVITNFIGVKDQIINEKAVIISNLDEVELYIKKVNLKIIT